MIPLPLWNQEERDDSLHKPMLYWGYNPSWKSMETCAPCNCEEIITTIRSYQVHLRGHRSQSLLMTWTPLLGIFQPLPLPLRTEARSWSLRRMDSVSVSAGLPAEACSGGKNDPKKWQKGKLETKNLTTGYSLTPVLSKQKGYPSTNPY